MTPFPPPLIKSYIRPELQDEDGVEEDGGTMPVQLIKPTRVYDRQGIFYNNSLHQLFLGKDASPMYMLSLTNSHIHCCLLPRCNICFHIY